MESELSAPLSGKCYFQIVKKNYQIVNRGVNALKYNVLIIFLCDGFNRFFLVMEWSRFLILVL